MKTQKTLKIGILGLGTVGGELVSLIQKNASRIEKETGISMQIEKILVRTMNKTRDITTTTLPLTTNFQSVVTNSDIDIICECMGGNGFSETKEYVKTALRQGKHVIMASKKALAHDASEILKLAKENQVQLKYDACVGGGIPIAKVLDAAFKGEKIVRIMGILNATSNFIYSNMVNFHLGFSEALKIAQEKGYAENDPGEDVDGYDSLNKLVILGLYGMNKWVQPLFFNPKSFRNIDIKDMQYAQELGYQIKPLALFKAENGTVENYVGPCLVPNGHILANTFQNFNSIIIEGSNSGEYGFYGQGAGAKPTAGAMFDDLVNLISAEKMKFHEFTEIPKSHLKEYQSNLYWRFTVKNTPGILAFLTAEFASRNINIEKIIQKDPQKDATEIVLLTSNASANTIAEIIEKLPKTGIQCNAIVPFV